MTEHHKAAAAWQFIATLPHARALGLRVEQLGAGVAVLSLPHDPRLAGAAGGGAVHAGAISALIDTAGGAAVIAHPDVPGATATLGLRIDHLRPPTPGQPLTARAECDRVTRHVAFVRIIARDAQEGAGPVATAQGTFTVSPAAGPNREGAAHG